MIYLFLFCCFLYSDDYVMIATAISDKRSDKPSLMIHEDDNTMHFIDRDNVNENYINDNEGDVQLYES